MKIVIVGAGAIGSLFGAFLANHNHVVLVGRKAHISAIQQHGLLIKGKTHRKVSIDAVETIEEIDLTPDLLMITVKSYDTAQAIQDALPLVHNHTVILSFQNGLGNIETIQQYVSSSQVLAGSTTHGALFSKPGVITHMGEGETVIGPLSKRQLTRCNEIVSVFTTAGIPTTVSTNVIRDLWVKAIVNSSINPLTAMFQCPNGYLLENPLLTHMVELICEESTQVATREGIGVTYPDMLQKTREVIQHTTRNHSSMLQSLENAKKTEIDAINGALVQMGKTHHLPTPLNELLCQYISELTSEDTKGK